MSKAEKRAVKLGEVKKTLDPEIKKLEAKPGKVILFDVNEHAIQVAKEDVGAYLARGYRQELPKKK